jgi:hypothetical protein
MPDVRTLSLIEIASYIQWRHDALTAKKGDDDG